MASVVDICNMALSHLGDSATLASIEPSEGSAQADHCSRWYPVARDALLEKYAWGFATRRIQLALLVTGVGQWQYAYACPSDALNLLAVMASDSPDDYPIGQPSPANQPFVNEMIGDVDCILTNQQNAMLRYTATVEDSQQFSPLFVVTLSWELAALLAGALIKGDSGVKAGQLCTVQAQQWFAKAVESDSNQRRVPMMHQPEFLRGRGLGMPYYPYPTLGY